MDTIHAKMFAFPAGHLDELHALAKAVYEARERNRRDRFYLANQVFVHAEKVAVAWVVLEQAHYLDPAVALWAWMRERFRGDKRNMVVDADEFEAIRRGLSVSRRDDLLLWADVHTPGAGNVDRVYLLEVYDAVDAMVRSVPPGPHGLVYGYFFLRHVEPPPPPEPKVWRSLSMEDTEHFKQSLRLSQRQTMARREFDFWPEEDGSEGRYVLGLLAPERATALRQQYLAAWQAIREHGHTIGYPRMQELIEQLEHELAHMIIMTRADRVYAHGCLNTLAGWDRPDERRGVATPEMARELWQRLDALEQEHGGTDGLIEQVWREARFWRRDAAREAYAQVRDIVRQAMDRGHGFAWLLDRDW